MSSAAEKANLARIRDNQRRSRARRKEYLQELEARLHQCELQGVEASAEIQQAARRVADENRKLRILLNRHGVTDDSVEAFLQSTTVNPDSLMDVAGYPTPQGHAGQMLEQLLNTKRHISADTGAPRRTTVGGSRDSSTASLGTQQGRWEPVFRAGSHASTPQQAFLTPASSAGRTSISSQQSSMRGNSTSTTLSSQPQGSAVIFDFNQLSSVMQPTHALGHPHYGSQQQQHFHAQQQQTHNQKLVKAHVAPHSLTPRSQGSQYITPPAGPIGMASCGFATDMITSMTGTDPSIVRAELGCGPGEWGSSSAECDVDNRVVFNVMDRYSGQGGMVGI